MPISRISPNVILTGWSAMTAIEPRTGRAGKLRSGPGRPAQTPEPHIIALSIDIANLNSRMASVEARLDRIDRRLELASV
jgi:hypothetical protein